MKNFFGLALLILSASFGQNLKSIAPGGPIESISDDFIRKAVSAGYTTMWVCPNYGTYTAEYTNGVHNNRVDSRLVQDYLALLHRVNTLSNGTLKLYPKVSGQSKWDASNIVNSKITMVSVKDTDIKSLASILLVQSWTGCGDAYGWSPIVGWACYSTLGTAGAAVHVVGVLVDKVVTGVMRFFGFSSKRTVTNSPTIATVETLVKSTNNPEADKTWKSTLTAFCIAHEEFQRQTGIASPIASVDLGGDEPYSYKVLVDPSLNRIADNGYSSATTWMNALLAEYNKKVGYIDDIAKTHPIITGAMLYTYADAIDPMVGQKHFGGTPNFSSLKKSRIVFRPWNYQRTRTGLDYAAVFSSIYRKEEVQMQITKDVWYYDTRAVAKFFENNGLNFAFTWAYPDGQPEQTRMQALQDWVAISSSPRCVGYNLYTDGWPHSDASMAMLSSAYAARSLAPAILQPQLLP